MWPDQNNSLWLLPLSLLSLGLWWLKKLAVTRKTMSHINERVISISKANQKRDRLLEEHEKCLQTIRVELEVLAGRFSERTQAIDSRLSAIAAAVHRIEQCLLRRQGKR